ncbi:hypothetical protein DPMN_039000 [Dreissena polymorpha]|uniref:Uncharacterized protein n=1 Tax=Dreissena polymorpha TaxID=45954 RepID=A0A9D4MHF6_DREPO|nr:hypothetical protein DPMN_039000 [Dreissena polymorpha]
MKISLPMDGMTPPLLIVGPFGTGKTYTLAQAAKCVVKVPSTRVLICTHSNRFAYNEDKSLQDMYIKQPKIYSLI